MLALTSLKQQRQQPVQNRGVHPACLGICGSSWPTMDTSCLYIKTHIGAEEGSLVLKSGLLRLPIALFCLRQGDGREHSFYCFTSETLISVVASDSLPAVVVTFQKRFIVQQGSKSVYAPIYSVSGLTKPQSAHPQICHFCARPSQSYRR